MGGQTSWKGKKPIKRETMKTIPEEEEIEEEKSGVREQTEEDDDKMGNMADPYYELQKIPWDEET